MEITEHDKQLIRRFIASILDIVIVLNLCLLVFISIKIFLFFLFRFKLTTSVLGKE